MNHLRCLSLIALACLCTGLASAADLSGFTKSALDIRTRTGHNWLNIYLAITDEQQERGLMFVRDLPADEGMLFPLSEPRRMAMWMKNTYIPLDMLFIDSAGRVVCLRERTKPLSEDLISCDKPVKAVLEIAAGQAEKRGISVGATVVHDTIAKVK